VRFEHDDLYRAAFEPSDVPTHPNDFEGNPAYPPLNTIHPNWQRLGRWSDLGPNGEYLRSTQTKWVYTHPANGVLWQLAGPGRGRQGVVLARELEGVLDPDYEIKWSEGAYMIGAKPERIDYKKRRINLGVVIDPNGNAERPEPSNPFAQRLIEDRWRASWSEEHPGYLGCFTRTHGLRWLPVLLGEGGKKAISVDPTEAGAAFYDMGIDAPWPFWAKRPFVRQWTAHWTQIDKYGVAHGNLIAPNRGTWKSWPKYIVRNPGDKPADVTIQDGPDGKIVKLPRIYPDTDGSMMLVDTDPSARTITTEKDPVDGQLYKFLRNSQLLHLLLSDVTDKRLPAQRRIPGGIGFDNPVAARTVVNIKVTHTNRNGSVTMLLPQWFRASWA
jgi:hypothetical protein